MTEGRRKRTGKGRIPPRKAPVRKCIPKTMKNITTLSQEAFLLSSRPMRPGPTFETEAFVVGVFTMLTFSGEA